MRATHVLIHTRHFRNNIRAVRARAGAGREICAAVKADAYGHGAAALSRIALEEGVSTLAVATVGEAAELRTAGINAPIILFSLVVPEEIPDIIALNLQPFAASLENVKELALAAARAGTGFRRSPTRPSVQPLSVHLKVDTGMGRIGCTPGDAPNIAQRITEEPSLHLAGVCTHFPAADTSNPDYTEDQIRRFSDVVDSIRRRGIHPGLVHAANSGAVIGHPPGFLDMIRPGIMLYGYYPSDEQDRHLNLQPVMEFKSRIVFMKKITRGTSVSYGRTWTAPEDTIVATIPAGYADGYNRLLSNRGTVMVGNQTYPVVGRVCMDQFMINLGPATPVRLYDEVILFGPAAPAPTAEDIARLTNTISYEVICRIDKRVPRIYTPEPKPEISRD